MAQQLRLVIADDESLIRMNLKETLVGLGYLVVGEAGDGVSVVNLARELRKADPAVPIVVVSRDHAGFYSKPMLSNALAGKKTATLMCGPGQVAIQPGGVGGAQVQPGRRPLQRGPAQQRVEAQRRAAFEVHQLVRRIPDQRAAHQLLHPLEVALRRRDRGHTPHALAQRLPAQLRGTVLGDHDVRVAARRGHRTAERADDPALAVGGRAR